MSGFDRLLELEQQVTEPGESSRAELLRPRGFDLGDRFADDADRGEAALREDDALGALVVGVRLPLEVTEALERAEQVVECLLADSQLGGEVGRPRTLRSRVAEDREVGRVEVVEAALVQ